MNSSIRLLLVAIAIQSALFPQPRPVTAVAAPVLMKPAVSGQGQPIVLIEGGLQGIESWGPLLPRLDATRRVIRLQNLNVAFGLKGQDLPPGYSVQTESAAVKRSLDELALRAPFDLIGWSSGGAIALDFALSNPDRIKSSH